MKGDSVKDIFIQGGEKKKFHLELNLEEMNKRWYYLVLLSVFTSHWKDTTNRFKSNDVKIKETISLVLYIRTS